MTSRKSQNSILFLTTLGVYLGLVLVGATPQVLAQAATAKQFSVKDEIGTKDKLDNDPDDCALLAAKFREKETLFAIDERAMLEYASVLSALVKEYARSPYKPLEFTWTSSTDHLSAIETSGKPILVPAKWSSTLEFQVRQLRSILVPAVGDGGEYALSTDAIGLTSTLKLQASNDIDAHRAKVAYDTNLDLWRCDVTDQRIKTLLEHTEVTWLESELIIVTRLPRGSLDSLLASDAK